MAGFDPVSYLMGQKAAGGGGGGSSTIAGLTDVDISNPTDGQTLVYNATSGKWENGASSGGVLVGTMPMGEPYALDLTWREINDAAFTVFHEAPGQHSTGLVYYVSACYYNTEDQFYYVHLTLLVSQAPDYVFRANSPDDYPIDVTP